MIMEIVVNAHGNRNKAIKSAFYIYDIYFRLYSCFSCPSATLKRRHKIPMIPVVQKPHQMHILLRMIPTKRSKMSKILEMVQSSHPSLNIQLIGGQLARRKADVSACLAV